MSEVREGYKMTELGVVPLDWSAEVLENIVNAMYQGINTVADKVEYIENGVPILQAKHITSEKISFKGTKFLSEKTYTSYQDKFQPELGDLLLSNIGTIGKVYYVNDIYKYLIAWNIFLIKPSNSVDSKYLAYVLRRLKQVGYYDKITTGNATKFINKQQMGKIKVGLPKLKEQQKIADILSTVDTQIEKTEQMIEQTKELKHGLMQQLLTKGIGHKEFKESELGEIPVSWNVLKLDELIKKIIGGGTPSRKKEIYYTGDIPWITVKDMQGAFYQDYSLEHITSDAIKESACNLIEKNNVIIATRIALGKAFINTKSVAINQDLKALYLSNKIINEYFLYSYLYKAREIEALGSGSTVKGIRLEQLKEIKFVIPPIEEQQKIAEILSSVDNQIDIYEKEKDKYEELKKGLMQQLLTGKIRVKVDE